MADKKSQSKTSTQSLDPLEDALDQPQSDQDEFLNDDNGSDDSIPLEETVSPPQSDQDEFLDDDQDTGKGSDLTDKLNRSLDRVDDDDDGGRSGGGGSRTTTPSDPGINPDRFKKDKRGGYRDTKRKQSVSKKEAQRRTNIIKAQAARQRGQTQSRSQPQTVQKQPSPFVQQFGQKKSRQPPKPQQKTTTKSRKKKSTQKQKKAVQRDRDRFGGRRVEAAENPPSNPFAQFTGSITEVAGGNTRPVKRLQNPSQPPAAKAGALVGTLGSIASLGIGGGAAGGAARATGRAVQGSRAAQRATQAAKAARATRAGKAATNVGQSGQYFALTEAAGQGIERGTILAGKQTAPEAQERFLKTSPGKKALKSGLEQQSQAADEAGFWKNIGEELTLFAGSKKQFSKGAKESLEQQGITGRQQEVALKALQRSRTTRGIAEAGGALARATGAEMIGTGGLVKALGRKSGQKLSRKQLFAQAGLSTGRAGAIEGAGQELGQQNIRMDQRSAGKRAKSVAKMGAYGAASAGILGGTIAAAAPTEPVLGRGVDIAASIADPFEKPGDIAASGIQRVQRGAARRSAKKATKKAIQGPGIDTKQFRKAQKAARKAPQSPVIDQEGRVQIPSITGTPTQTMSQSRPPAANGGRGPGRPLAPIDVPTVSGTKTPVSTPSISDTPPTKPPTDIPPISGKKGGGKPVPDPVPSPSPSTTPTPPPTITNIFAPQSPSQSKQQTPTTTPTAVPTSLPVNTPIARTPPPVPPFIGGGAGSSQGATFKGKRQRYFNELQAGRELLSQGIAPLGNRQGASSKKAKKKKQNKGQQGVQLPFRIL